MGFLFEKPQKYNKHESFKQQEIYLLHSIHRPFFVETLIAIFLNDKFIRPYGGDIIVEWLVYCFVRIFIPEKYKLLPLYVFIFSVLIEISQYFKLVEVLGLQGNPILRTMIGNTFNWNDIWCYAVGCILIAIGSYIYKNNNFSKKKY
ncbi:MAG TPA: DUF2809 domain-containing protein [Paludibacteraceae bacterium]|nr:DUF2809 domain-containing protein [Paludibacteraceae bacterium]